MYLRTTQRRNKDGSIVRSYPLADNVRHPEKGHVEAKVVHSFGRADRLDRAARARLVRSIRRVTATPASMRPLTANSGQVEDCIAREVDAIEVDPIESSSLLGVLEEAGQRNIPVATLDTPVDSPDVVTLIGVPQREASYTFGQFVAGWIIGKLGGEAKVGIMLASTEVQLARRDGFVDALAAVPGAEIVATGDGRNILERATAEAEDMLTAQPDINVIYATGDPQLQGGLAAAAAQGREIAFFGWDDIPEPFLKPLEDGRIVGFLKQKPEVGGEMAVRLLSDHLEGKEIPKRFTYSPDVVTQYNLDQFR